MAELNDNREAYNANERGLVLSCAWEPGRDALEKKLCKPSKSLKSWSSRGASPPPGPSSRALPCTYQGP
ncbi:hypothetical protein DPMN_029785 [Dreissena polymorpha]|uniref:Uncharacterized protein n=1 Tax=Dreissena polymorpha TaxID=45954 RepID=A0A9D4RFK7_DREPO|nr:hypothetical protein DPMN_029785 [Dreissena polymorpha]